MAIDWMANAQAMRDELIARRRDFHIHPETAFEEFRTAGIVANELNTLGLEVMTGIGKTGVVGILEGSQDGPTVLVRCDMDALPVIEANSTEYISQTPGKMHACGHDGHTAIALSVVKMFAAHREKIAGRIKFVFQPAEEIGQGARAMIDDGVLNAPVPEVCLGLHLWNGLSLGEVSVTEGAAMAGVSDWDITVRGRGGHGAIPETTADPIVAASQIVGALQTIVSRNVSGLDTAVVSCTMFHAGDAHNVIPPEAKLAGTFRTYRKEVTDLVTRRMHEIATGIATALGCEADVNTVELLPPMTNHPSSNKRVREVFSRVNTPIPITWKDSTRTMAAEDMGLFLERVPGTYFFVGSANTARGLDYMHHHPRFDFDEDALPIAAGLLASAVADYVIHE